MKVYAAYRSGCLGDNILDTYFPFFANIIYEQHWDEIDEKKIADPNNIDLSEDMLRVIVILKR